MPLLFASVARGGSPQCSFAATGVEGNFDSVASEFNEKASKNEGKFTYVVDGHTFNFLTKDGYTFLVVADGAYGRAIPSGFLDRCYQAFAETYAVGDEGCTTTAAMVRPFSKQLKALMEAAARNPAEFSKLAGVQEQIAEVRGGMADNIDRMIQRGEQLELLTERADDLITESQLFHRKARLLRWRVTWADARSKVAIVGLVVLVLCLVILGLCLGVVECMPQ
ncbi:hypothetical protein FOA52_009452 [Chlamydomonas sp. UWO 241]|nr:hypothetical protein FOA52_009452 [Chlamydomonas sp. UWO 241]